MGRELDFKHPFRKNKLNPFCPELPLTICKWQLEIRDKWQLEIRDRLSSLMPGHTGARVFLVLVFLLRHVRIQYVSIDIIYNEVSELDCSM